MPQSGFFEDVETCGTPVPAPSSSRRSPWKPPCGSPPFWAFAKEPGSLPQGVVQRLGHKDKLRKSFVSLISLQTRSDIKQNMLNTPVSNLTASR